MTAEDFKECGIPINIEDEETLIYINSAVEWLKENTTLNIDINNTETIKALPSSAKLFILKFCDLISSEDNVLSESIAGMSQSFSSEKKSSLIMDIARQLLKNYLKSDFKFVPAVRKWL